MIFLFDRILRSGVSGERWNLRKRGKVCGGLPMRRYAECDGRAGGWFSIAAYGSGLQPFVY
jgi:hypothetical protein